jgi:hypothetical protein
MAFLLSRLPAGTVPTLSMQLPARGGQSVLLEVFRWFSFSSYCLAADTQKL